MGILVVSRVKRELQSHDQSMGRGLVGFEQMELKSLPLRMCEPGAGT